jgi:hypothetical protein
VFSVTLYYREWWVYFFHEVAPTLSSFMLNAECCGARVFLINKSAAAGGTIDYQERIQLEHNRD